MEDKTKQAPQNSNTETYVLVNAYDELVRTKVGAMMAQTDMCQCEKCFMDACAIVFNRNYAHFVTTRAGVLLSKVPEMNQSSKVKLTVAVADALKRVREQPNH